MRVSWDKGGEAELLTLSMDKAVLLSERPSPPGSRIEGTLQLERLEKPEKSESTLRVRFKVHTCRREADGRFTIEGRPLDLTRDVLAKVTPQP